jgi:hypothetical protein
MYSRYIGNEGFRSGNTLSQRSVGSDKTILIKFIAFANAE